MNRNGTFFVKLLVPVICFLLATQTTAGIVVIPNLINLSKKDLPRTDVTVINEGNDEAYIKVTPNIILNPGTPREHPVVIHNPQKYGLLVSPQQLIIPPKQRRLIRFMLAQDLSDKERIYRVDIVPVTQEIIPLKKGKRAQTAMGLQMLIGYGVLTIVRPIDPELKITTQRKGKTLFLENKGNSNVEISNIQQCQGKICHSIKPFVRLYAGNKLPINLKLEAPVKMTAQLLDERIMLTSN